LNKMKKIFFLLAGLPKDIHSVNDYVQRAYEGWNRLYTWLHPNGRPVERVEPPAEPAPPAEQPASQALALR
jgi:hypothetical protein